MVVASCKNTTENTTNLNSTTNSETSVVDEAELVKAAKDAYIFFYPMVMMYRTMYLQALDPNGGVGMGNWLHLGVSTPNDTTIVTPNNDSPYSYAWVDLRTEPYVLTMPNIEKDRFYTSQWDDLSGFVVDNVGSVNDGNEGVSVLLAGPDYSDGVPLGIDRVIKGGSFLLGTLTRTQLVGIKDLPRVKEIQKGYKLQPLSEFQGEKAPEKAPDIKWIKWEEGVEKGEGFWRFAGFLSQFETKKPEDTEKWQSLAMFGFEKDKFWDVNKLSASEKKALNKGQKEAIAHLEELASKPFNTQKFFNSRRDMQALVSDPYEQKALGVYVGIFGNTKKQSVYYGIQEDIKGNQPDASKYAYTLTFQKDELPKVNNFWSITMYSLPKRLFVHNELNRYSIGSTSPDMKYNDDGSLTLYLQSNSPGKDKEGNWLPAPDGPFWPVLRCYGPSKAIIDGIWKEPVLVPVEKK